MRLRYHHDAVHDRIPHLAFRLAGEEYALPLLSVKEIVRLQNVTAVRKAPEALLGVMSLRGEAVPILDLSVALGHGRAEETAESCVLVAEAQVGETRAPLGLAVDGVSRLLDLAAADIAAPPRLGRLVTVDLIRAMARVEAGFVPILDLACILASEELRGAVAASRAEGEDAPGPDAIPAEGDALATPDVLAAGRAARSASEVAGGAPGSASGEIKRPRAGRNRPRRRRPGSGTHDA